MFYLPFTVFDSVNLPCTLLFLTRCLLKAPEDYDWEDDAPPHHEEKDLVIYEAHVRGFTYDASSGLPQELRGTYEGMTRKAAYLAELGITAIELLPVFEFDETACPFSDPVTGKKNRQYWGYGTVSFFAPMAR